MPLKLGEILPSRPPLPAITLAQAIPKGKNMDLIVQKSVELGIAAGDRVVIVANHLSFADASLKAHMTVLPSVEALEARLAARSSAQAPAL